MSGAQGHDEPEFKMSPSEERAHNGAMRIAGTKDPSSQTQKALASITLGFELIIVVLIGLSMYGLGVLDPRWLGLAIGGVLAVVALAGLALMRKGRVGINIGWALHVLMLASGFLVPAAFFVGLVFTALWVFCMVKGAKIDRDRMAWMAANS